MIRFISSRKPFALKGALIIYNLAVSLLNLYIAIELLIASTALRYNYVCEPCRHQDFSKDELRVCDSPFGSSMITIFFLNTFFCTPLGNECCVVVLLFKMHRVLRQFLLYFTQKGQATIVLARVRSDVFIFPISKRSY